MKKDIVCAVVVTFNRKELLTECLKSLLNQKRSLDAIYIIDNASTDGTSTLLKEKGFISRIPQLSIKEPYEISLQYNSESEGMKNSTTIYYVRMHVNTGGAGGFYEGVKRAYEKGYDWLWLMDDDSEPYEDSLKILESYFEDQNIVGLANSVIKTDNQIDLNHRGLADFQNMYPTVQQPLSIEMYNKEEVEIHTASFVGLLIRSKVIEQIGFPLKEFFIHNDDIEYCLRLMKKGKILLVPASKIKHKEASHYNNSRPQYKNFWLQYYSKRNLVILAKKYSTNKVKFYFYLFKATVREIGGILLYDDNKLKRIYFIIQRIIDGLYEVYDNNKSKKILYNT